MTREMRERVLCCIFSLTERERRTRTRYLFLGAKK